MICSRVERDSDWHLIVCTLVLASMLLWTSVGKATETIPPLPDRIAAPAADMGSMADDQRQLVWGLIIALVVSLVALELVMINRRRALAAERTRNEYLAAVHEMALGLLKRRSLNTLTEAIVRRAAAVAGVKHGFFYVHDAEHNELEMCVGIGDYAPTVGIRISPGHGLAGKAFAAGKTVTVADYRRFDRRIDDVCFDRLRACAAIPLPSGAGVIGLGYFAPSEERFRPAQIEALNRFAELAAIVLDNAQLYEKFKNELHVRRETEKVLRAGEQRYRTLFEESPVSLWEEDFSELIAHLGHLKKEGVTDFEAFFSQHPEQVRICADKIRIVDVNRATVALYEADSKAQLLGSLAKVIPPEAEDIFRQEMIALADGRVFEVECPNVTLKGRSLMVLLRLSVAHGHEQTWSRALISVVDITERRQAEQDRQRVERQLRQAQHLEAVATLAGGVAHNFNNILTGMSGNLELLKIGMPPADHRNRHHFDVMFKAVDRMVSLTGQLLAFARSGHYQLVPVALDDAVVPALSEDGDGNHDAIRICRRLSEASPVVMMDKAQIRMVVEAVVENAVEAMAGRGTLTITSGRAQRQHLDQVPDDVSAEQFGWVTIADTGPGMDAATLGNIFEPFYTTHFIGRGLGMASAHGIVRHHGGWINVTSAAGRGTSVTLYLPLAERV